MKFNSTDKSNSIIADIDFLLFGDSSTLNDSYTLVDRTRNVNIALDETVVELFKADPNFKWDDTTNPDFPIATITTSADHITLPDSSLVISRVRMKDSSGKFKTLDTTTRRELSDSELNSTGTPTKYYKIDNAVFPIPAPAASYEYEIEFQRGANHFTTTDTDKSPGFASIFHQILSIKPAKRYAMANGMNDKKVMLEGMENKIILDIREHYQLRSPDERPQLRLRRKSISSYGL